MDKHLEEALGIPLSWAEARLAAAVFPGHCFPHEDDEAAWAALTERWRREAEAAGTDFQGMAERAEAWVLARLENR